MMNVSFFREGFATQNPTAFHASTPIPASHSKSVQGLVGGLILFLLTGSVAQALQLQNAAVADQPAAGNVGNSALPAPRKSEFSSLIVADYQPVNGALGVDQDPDAADFNRSAANTASVTLKTLAWLFGIGIIGMGTVGRRRRK